MRELQVVNFYGDKVYLIAIDNEPFVPVRPIAENLGLVWKGQHRKLQEDSQRWQVQTIRVKAQDGASGDAVPPLRKFPAWRCRSVPRR